LHPSPRAAGAQLGAHLQAPLGNFPAANININGGTSLGSKNTSEVLIIGWKNNNYNNNQNMMWRINLFANKLIWATVLPTENIMTAAVLAKGKTTLDNAAREPDIVDLGNFLIAMGADISGLGTPKILITGVKTLLPTDHTTLPDRVVTGTWAFAAAITQGDITIHNCRPSDLEVPLDKLVLAGAVITTTKDGIRVKMDHRPKAIDVATLPYPGFPTDLQPMIITLNSIADGDAIVTENVFEGRFMFVNELTRLGAKIRVDGHHAAISGIPQLSSAPVVATDIRAGAGLVLAGLVSDGITFVEGGFHIDRGYPNFAKQLELLGADVTRVD
jgi:UDP-N-acetylglucosamine 1-carboxyvinyltransferase